MTNETDNNPPFVIVNQHQDWWKPYIRADAYPDIVDKIDNVMRRENTPQTCAEADRQTKERFKRGDVVQLKGGGLRMTVAMICIEDVTCQWFDGTKLDEHDFHCDVLRLVGPDELPF